MKNYEVVISTGGNADTAVFPVTDWQVKGAALVPVYDNGMTPQDESPWADVRIREVKA